MKRISFELDTKDNLVLSGHSWQPDNGVPKASVAMVHGMGEHIMRYDNWAGRKQKCQIKYDSIGVG